MKRREFLKIMAGAVGFFAFNGFEIPKVESANLKDGYHIVLLSDTHLPWRGKRYTDATIGQKIFAQKEKLVKTINSWNDVKEVTLLGDLPARYGNEDEFLSVDAFLKEIKKPKYIIAGNHDYAYKSKPGKKEKLDRATHAEQIKKLNAFKERYKMPSLYYARTARNYRLLYLAPDACGNINVELSQTQLEWLREEIANYKNGPIIFFCHAPLKGTLLDYGKSINKPSGTAQPEEPLAEILKNAPKGSLWISGHTHTPPTNESFANDNINRYNENIINIHNPSLDEKHLWTNSLYLFKDRVIVRTYDHTKDEWVEKFTREYPFK